MLYMSTVASPFAVTRWCLPMHQDIVSFTVGHFWLRTRESSMSEILSIGWALACIGSVVNRVTVDFAADINSELSFRKQDISVR